MTNNPFFNALQTFNAGVRAGVEFQDPNWTNSAITRERARRVEAAREALKTALKDTPAQAAVQDTAPLRQAALDQLRPMDADTIAVANNEWAKAEKLLRAGWSYDQLIRAADRQRLVAMLDQLPTELAATSPNPESVIAEVEGLVLGRLIELDDSKATQFDAARQSASYDESWREVLAQSIDGSVTVDAWSALYRSSPDDYREAMQSYSEASDALDQVQHLIRVAASTARPGGPVGAH
jgi:hypothetical protein